MSIAQISVVAEVMITETTIAELRGLELGCAIAGVSTVGRLVLIELGWAVRVRLVLKLMRRLRLVRSV